MVREYRDTAKAVNRRVGPVNGLYGGFVFWPLPCPDGQGRKNAACKPLEGHTSGGKMPGSIGTWPPMLDGMKDTKKPAPVWGGWWLLLVNLVKIITAGPLVAESGALVLVVCVAVRVGVVLLPVLQVVLQVVLVAVHAPRLGGIVPSKTTVNDNILGHIGAPVAAGPLPHGEIVRLASLIDDNFHGFPLSAPVGLSVVLIVSPSCGLVKIFSPSPRSPSREGRE